MHRAKLVWQWMKSSAGKVWHWSRVLAGKLGQVPKHGRSWQGPNPLPPLAILVGTLAFGFWWQSFAAALFGCIFLWFLAGIYKSGERILAAAQEGSSQPESNRTEIRVAEREPEDAEAVREAIGGLKPWLANEVQLSEENAKEFCAVLVDSVAARARQLTTRF